MAVTNVFGVTQKVDWGTVTQFENALTTASLATPYTEFDNTSAIGKSATLRYPILQQSNRGLAFTDDQINNTIQRTRQIAIVDDPVTGTIHNAPIGMGALDFSFNIAADSVDEFWKEYIYPLTLKLGCDLNGDLISDMEENFTDTIGSASAQLDGNNTMQRITAMLSAMGLNNQGQSYFAMSPFAFSALQSPYANYFNQPFNTPILKDNLQTKGGNFAGIDCYMDQTIKTHTNGTWATGSSVTVTAVAGTGDINAAYSTLSLENLSNGATIKKGDRIYIGAVSPTDNRILMINGQDKAAFNVPKTFRVVEDVTAGVSGEVDIKIFPPIVPPDSTPGVIQPAQQNASRNAAIGDVITVFGGGSATYVLNYVYIRKAIVFANPRLYYSPIQPKSKDARPLFAIAPYQQSYSEKVGHSNLMMNFDIMSAGDIKTAANTIVARSACAPASYQGYGFVVASSI